MVRVVKPLSPFKHDSPNEYAGFFTAFRMTFRGVFVILNELLGEEESLRRGDGMSSETFMAFQI
jgi:hypothetical protein